jgi:hypothetical protein
MARLICERCKAVYFVVNGFIDGTDKTEHLCKDLEKRLKRQTKQVEAVVNVLRDFIELPYVNSLDLDKMAYEIVKELTHLQINMEE